MGVSADQSACAEFDAAEITRDNDGNIREFLFLDRFEDRITGRAARFAVIV